MSDDAIGACWLFLSKGCCWGNVGWCGCFGWIGGGGRPYVRRGGLMRPSLFGGSYHEASVTVLACGLDRDHAKAQWHLGRRKGWVTIDESHQQNNALFITQRYLTDRSGPQSVSNTLLLCLVASAWRQVHSSPFRDSQTGANNRQSNRFFNLCHL